VRVAQFRAGVDPQLRLKPLSDLVVVLQRHRLLTVGGQHQHQPRLQRLVQVLTGGELPQQRQDPLRLGAGQGGVSGLADGGDVFLVHGREVSAGPAAQLQALPARPPPQAECFGQQLERVRGLIGGVGRRRVPHHAAEGDQIRRVRIGGKPVRGAVPGQPPSARPRGAIRLEQASNGADVLVNDIDRAGRGLLLP
jgi:hypothetical protein